MGENAGVHGISGLAPGPARPVLENAIGMGKCAMDVFEIMALEPLIMIDSQGKG